jgi:hypothetical protein
VYIKQTLLQSPRRSCSRIVLVFFLPHTGVARSNLISGLDVNENTCVIRISESFRETSVISRIRQFLHIFRKIGRFVTVFTTVRYLALF